MANKETKDKNQNQVKLKNKRKIVNKVREEVADSYNIEGEDLEAKMEAYIYSDHLNSDFIREHYNILATTAAEIAGGADDIAIMLDTPIHNQVNTNFLIVCEKLSKNDERVICRKRTYKDGYNINNEKDLANTVKDLALEIAKRRLKFKDEEAKKEIKKSMVKFDI